MKLVHLVKRFFGALWPGRPPAEDLAWVQSALTPAELALWQRLPNHDQRHSIGVARDVWARLAGTPYADDPRWPAVALLHDVGKLDAGLGVYGRVVATVCGFVGGRSLAGAWSARRGFTRRVGLYLRHDELGADMIRMAGGRKEAALWAAAHHHPEAWPSTGLPSAVIDALDAADND
ncbi:MAG: hypothetical protein U0V73_09200 [Acidimicrobiia bacterium]